MIHTGFKTYNIYKNIPCQYNDGVNYKVDDCMLKDLMNRCAERHPNSNIWYEVINVKPMRRIDSHGENYGEHTFVMCDLRIVYKPEVTPVEHDYDTEVITEVKYTTSNRPYVVGSHREIIKPVVSSRPTKTLTGYKYRGFDISDKFEVAGTIFVGKSLDDVITFCDYVKKAPECYKVRAMKYCQNLADLEFKTDYNGECKLIVRTAQKSPKSDSFHRRMASGNRYQY